MRQVPLSRRHHELRASADGLLHIAGSDRFEHRVPGCVAMIVGVAENDSFNKAVLHGGLPTSLQNVAIENHVINPPTNISSVIGGICMGVFIIGVPVGHLRHVGKQDGQGRRAGAAHVPAPQSHAAHADWRRSHCKNQHGEHRDQVRASTRRIAATGRNFHGLEALGGPYTRFDPSGRLPSDSTLFMQPRVNRHS